MYGDIEEILYTREVIDERVKELAAQVMGVYRERSLTVAVALNGAFIFAADLVRHLAENVEIVFLRSASYGNSARPEHAPKVEIPDTLDWAGRDVLLVEDIVDTGRTMQAIVAALHERGASTVRLCTFLDKPGGREVPIEAEFVGFTLDGSPFVVGYGLDYGGRYRNLPFLGTVKPAASGD